MTKRRIHRISVYLLDPDNKRVLLHLSEEPPFIGQYMPLSAPLSEWETPTETARNLVSAATNLDFELLGHNPSLPLVLDETSAKIFPPLHVQVTRINEDNDFVDYVYLGRAKAAPDLKEGGPLVWFNKSNLKSSPTHVKHIVHYVLALMS